MKRLWTCGALAVVLAAGSAAGADRPQWGRRGSRNMVSDETNLPASSAPGEVGPDGEMDLAGARNVRWAARLGSEANSTPVVAAGKVFIGTNNRRPRDGRHKGDRGVLLCFDEATGKFLWQLVVPKLTTIRNADWKYVGISSSPSVEGDRMYLVSNRGEVLCLDTDGMADGNDGPYRDEGRHMTLPGRAPLEATATDADIVWIFDMVADAGVSFHNAANCSILIHGRMLYVCTSNGVEWTHKKPARPEAPSLIVLDKTTGRLVARDDAGIGPHVFHGQWSSPSLGVVGGRELVFFGGGDGVCYAFEALKAPAAGNRPATLKMVWKFRCDTEGREVRGRASLTPPDPNGPSTILGMPVFHKDRVYVAAGGDPWHGKRSGGLYCIDATGTGDVTKTARLWEYKGIGQCIATVSVDGALVYVAGHDGRLHCLDAETGKCYWVHEGGGPGFGSTLLADGKVYHPAGKDGLWVLAAGKKKKVLGRIRLGGPVRSSPVAANGALYVATRRWLYAVAAGGSATRR